MLYRACLKFENRGKNDKAQFFNYLEDAFNVVAICFLIFFRFGTFKKTARKKRYSAKSGASDRKSRS